MSLTNIRSETIPASPQPRDGRQPDYQKKLWEQAFWEQQRQIQMNDAENRQTPMPEQQPATKEAMMPTAPERINNTTTQVPVLVSHPHLNLTASSPLAADQDAVIIGNRSSAASAGPGLTITTPVNAATRQPAAILSTATQTQRTLATGMLHTADEEASVWLGHKALQDDHSLLRQIREALNFFGLKLKQLTIHGTGINRIHMNTDLNPQKESEHGH
ncbi:hypothetical protein [Gynuella sunshinyii]|uniref:Uncharacterized protein n=1 Tax=Gynuella sunshinyii YC6258 TaxID=1445510 RepID=A0A0C5VEV7_9GAMM|nr:hypothetical protein [Gynuella sunshinyii]AJQ92711.1 hypothetical Protein YC6258_00661 [Gynuella sunshinyii YC6258]